MSYQAGYNTRNRASRRPILYNVRGPRPQFQAPPLNMYGNPGAVPPNFQGGQSHLPPPNFQPNVRYDQPLLFNQFYTPPPNNFHAPPFDNRSAPPRNRARHTTPLNRSKDAPSPRSSRSNSSLSNISALNENGSTPNVNNQADEDVIESVSVVSVPQRSATPPSIVPQHLFPEVIIKTPNRDQPTPTQGLMPVDNAPNEQFKALTQQIQDLTIHLGTQLETVCQEIPKLIQTEVNKLKAKEPSNKEPVLSAVDMKKPHVPKHHSSVESVARNNFGSRRHDTKSFNRSDIKAFEKLKGFNGNREFHHPKDFIKKLLNFYDTYQVPDSILLNEMDKLLTGPAETWFSISQQSFDTVQDFADAFLAKFWHNGLQNQLRTDILTRNTEPTYGNYVDYFLNFVRQAQYLDVPLDPAVVISAITVHFPKDVQVALAQNNATTVDKVVETLQIFDQLRLKPKSARTSTAQTNTQAYQKPFVSQDKPKFPNFKSVNAVSCDAQDFSQPPPTVTENVTDDLN